MAGIIRVAKTEGKERKPVLIDRIDGFECEIFAATLLPKEDGFISTSDDK